jgi:hypothetical protein
MGDAGLLQDTASSCDARAIVDDSNTLIAFDHGRLRWFLVAWLPARATMTTVLRVDDAR